MTAKPVQVDSAAASTRPLEGCRVLVIVENLPVPFDRRVWQESRTLRDAGAQVTVICPIGKGFEKRDEVLEGIQVYRHPLPKEADGGLGYLIEYAAALYWETRLAFRTARRGGIDVIHGCNPPDLIFLIAWLFKPFGKKFIFDHHDINPELYEAKFGRRGLFWRLLTFVERLTFMTADVSIATNNSYRKIAIDRGKMKPEDVFVVRSGPDLTRVKAVPANLDWKRGRAYLVGYVGVMGEQEGVDLLLEAVRYIVQVKGRHDIQFCLVGGGPSFEALQALSRNMGLEDYVTFTGRAPDQVLFEVLSTADICVNPDRVNEMNDKSTMNKILEYMATSKPIVQFDVTEGRFSAAEASLYAAANDPVSFAENILQLADNAEMRSTMGAFGRARVVDGLSWQHEAPKLIEAYQRVWQGVRGKSRQRKRVSSLVVQQ